MKRRIILWFAVAVYTISLPCAITVYEVVGSFFSVEIAGLIPLCILTTAGSAYVFLGIRMGRPARYITLVVPCAVIVWLVIFLEPNEAKHIHIPEYILMSWLVFEALRIDYSDAGIYLVVFLLASFLGVADEIHQGIHPTRCYGWRDLLVNGVSSLIGVVSIIGVRGAYDSAGWRPPRCLSRRKGIGAVIAAGMASIAVNGCILVSVAGSHDQWRNFPDRLGAWDMIFIVVAGVGCAAVWADHGDDMNRSGPMGRSWLSITIAFLVLLMVIHLMIIGAVLGDVPFR